MIKDGESERVALSECHFVLGLAAAVTFCGRALVRKAFLRQSHTLWDRAVQWLRVLLGALASLYEN